MNKESLHLYGLTVIFISSKVEDITPISLDSIIKEAGHNKFHRKEILKAELEILQLLNFRICQETLYDIAFA